MGFMELVFGDLNKKEVKKLSRIADKVLALDEEMQKLTDDELRGARSVLRAAAMTYVAALLVSFAQLLRLILLYGNRRRD